MQSDLGKCFIGGISWDTTEDRLKEYFGAYGEILETVIMRDRTTGRARGFGFVVFADPAVADRVIKDKHNIDGRLVEAKKAIPRDDNSSVKSRSSSSIQGSPGPLRTKKIFVGGLASTVTETDFKNYFEQFGTITDVVVMYDHNTHRPRGFGFITYDSEDAVEKVLFKTFHELNGKMVEVKRAVPKELSPSPIRSPLTGYNYGASKINDLLNGYSTNSLGGYGLRVDGRFSPIMGNRNAFGPLGNSYDMGLNLNIEPGMNTNFGGSPNFGSGMNYGRGANPLYIGNNTNRLENTINYDNLIGGSSSFFSSGTRNLFGNGALNIGSGGNNSGANWGSNTLAPQRGIGNVASQIGNLGHGNGDNIYNLGGEGVGGSYGRNIIPSGVNISQPRGDYDRVFSENYGGGSVYGDPTWRSANSDREGSGSFGYGLGSGVSDVPAETSQRFLGGYNMGRDR